MPQKCSVPSVLLGSQPASSISVKLMQNPGISGVAGKVRLFSEIPTQEGSLSSIGSSYSGEIRRYWECQASCCPAALLLPPLKAAAAPCGERKCGTGPRCKPVSPLSGSPSSEYSRQGKFPDQGPCGRAQSGRRPCR